MSDIKLESNTTSNEEVPSENDTDVDKLLSGKVPADVYWEFKKAATARKEKMQDAVLNAALLYIAAGPLPKEDPNT